MSEDVRVGCMCGKDDSPIFVRDIELWKGLYTHKKVLTSVTDFNLYIAYFSKTSLLSSSTQKDASKMKPSVVS